MKWLISLKESLNKIHNIHFDELEESYWNWLELNYQNQAFQKSDGDKLYFSIQKIDTRYINRLTQRIQELRNSGIEDRKTKFIQKIEEMNDRDNICIDWAHFSFDWVQGGYDCFKKGERRVGRKWSTHIKNIYTHLWYSSCWHGILWNIWYQAQLH